MNMDDLKKMNIAVGTIHRNFFLLFFLIENFIYSNYTNVLPHKAKFHLTLSIEIMMRIVLK